MHPQSIGRIGPSVYVCVCMCVRMCERDKCTSRVSAALVEVSICNYVYARVRERESRRRREARERNKPAKYQQLIHVCDMTHSYV